MKTIHPLDLDAKIQANEMVEILDLRPRAQNPDWKITPTLVRRGASIGANATLVCGIEVGEYAMIAAGSVVTKDVQPYQLVAGNPARPRGWVDERGEIVSREIERG